MFDAEVIHTIAQNGVHAPKVLPKISPSPSIGYVVSKRLLDIVAVLLLAPFAIIAALGLLVLNPIFNKGSLFFRQTRMGQNCVPFTAYKFRSMTETAPVKRGAFDALEEDRITKLGCVMRTLRIDELPQLINILKGDMTLVGPRPDFIDHANVYIEEIPGYCDRYTVRPGVTGLAQTEVGYVSDEAGFRHKVAADLMYIRKMSLLFDLKVILRTVQIVVVRHGK
ncbi:MAG: sugar transferase [Paracoccaceae bacterium]|jgi:lipopolysaccharide/colanic/teichoic acid biosynthesis glycosyltransferase|nr:sugar transferase [Paracoccaceae bacterium]MDP7184676.1 sugar transferase [Paracoccaceae bacterium]